MAGSTWAMVGNMLSLMVMASIVIAFYRAHKNDNSIVRLDDLFGEDGHIGGSKMRMNLFFFLCVWVVIYTTLKGTLQEWMVAAIGAIIAWDRKNARETPAQTMPPVPVEKSKEQE
jgi:phosphotransferase system  glucose/maltose/N-acetylglucosamine-specific IIC component